MPCPSCGNAEISSRGGCPSCGARFIASPPERTVMFQRARIRARHVRDVLLGDFVALFFLVTALLWALRAAGVLGRAQPAYAWLGVLVAIAGAALRVPVLPGRELAAPIAAALLAVLSIALGFG